MFDNPLSYISAVAGAIGIVTATRAFVAYIGRARREVVHQRWTAQQEAHLMAGGPRFKLQILRKDRASLEWALAQGRLRVTKDMPWGWYVMAETRLLRRGRSRALSP